HEASDEFGQILLAHEGRSLLRAEPLACALLAFGPLLGNVLDLHGEDMHLAAPLHAGTKNLVVVEPPQIALRDWSGYAGLFSCLARRCFIGLFALFRPSLRYHPAPGAPAGHKHDFVAAVLAYTPGQGGDLYTTGHATEQAPDTLHPLLAFTIGRKHEPKITL